MLLFFTLEVTYQKIGKWIFIHFGGSLIKISKTTILNSLFLLVGMFFHTEYEGTITFWPSVLNLIIKYLCAWGEGGVFQLHINK